MTRSEGQDNSVADGETATPGETKPHGYPMQKDGETAEGMMDTMKMLFSQVDHPQPSGTQPQQRSVEENLQTPGQPFLPHSELDEGFRAGSEKNFVKCKITYNLNYNI